MTAPVDMRPASQLRAFVMFERKPGSKVQAVTDIYGIWASGMVRSIKAGEWEAREKVHPGVPVIWENVSEISKYAGYDAALRDAGTDD